MSTLDAAHVYRLRTGTRAPLTVIALILAVGGAVIAAVPFVLPLLSRRTYGPPIWPVIVFASIVAAVLLLLAVLLVRMSSAVRLEIRPDGLTYHQVGFTLQSDWQNVVRVQPIAYGEALVLRQSGLVSTGRFRRYGQINRQDHLIPLTPFGWWWRDSQLGQDVLRYAPQVFDAAAWRPEGSELID